MTPQSCLGHGGYTSCSVTLLPTAVIKVRTLKEKLVSLRALLDSGSQVTCITSKCRERLQLRQRQADIRVSGIGGTLSAKSGSIVGLQIIPPHQEEITTTAVVLDQVTRRLPSYQIEDKSLNTVKDLKWTDPDFKTPGEIDIILGGDVNERIVGDEKRAITKDLFSRNTAFGWVVSGKVTHGSSTAVQALHVTLDDQLTKFWELEEIPQKINLMTNEEKACEKLFDKTTTLKDNRFVVQLPFKTPVLLGDSLDQAKKRFYYLERRLDAKRDLRKGYQAFIQEFKDMDHIEEVPQHEIERSPDKCYYLPHHCVFKEDSTTTKLRVVFDGSAKTTNGVSIN